jgi:hypothetical protein
MTVRFVRANWYLREPGTKYAADWQDVDLGSQRRHEHLIVGLAAGDRARRVERVSIPIMLRGFMRHAYMYNGAFEKNYSSLSAGTKTYTSTDGTIRQLPEWPAKVDGIRVSYMEKAGKKFYAVRVQYDNHDVVLENPVYIDPMRHMNNRRFAADPTYVNDDEASALLDDVIRDNPEKQPELAMMINRINQIRRDARSAAES